MSGPGDKRRVSGVRGACQGIDSPRPSPGVICTIRVMHRTLRVIYIFQFCVHPLALGDPPAGRPGRPEPASLGAVPDSVTPADRAPRRKSPHRQAPSAATQIRQAVARAGPCRPDPDRFTRIPSPGRGLCGPGHVTVAGPALVTLMTWPGRERGRHQIRRSRPNSNFPAIRPST